MTIAYAVVWRQNNGDVPIGAETPNVVTIAWWCVQTTALEPMAVWIRDSEAEPNVAWNGSQNPDGHREYRVTPSIQADTATSRCSRQEQKSIGVELFVLMRVGFPGRFVLGTRLRLRIIARFRSAGCLGHQPIDHR